MKRHLPSLALLALTAASLAAQPLAPARQLNLQPIRDTQTAPILCPSRVTPEPLKITTSRQNVVLEEDFSHVPDGEIDPAIGRRTTYIASHYYEPGRYVNTDYTPAFGTWEGDNVMAGTNGTIFLQTYNPMQAAYIATPLGDYSGDLTITLRARAAKSFYGDSNSETGYWTGVGSDLTIYASRGGYDKNTPTLGDDSEGANFRFYPNDGWVEVVVDMHIESSDNDGFIRISSSSALEIDQVKIVDNCTFLSSPTLLPETNFTPTSFTINWQPVRRSFNYYLDLWSKEYTSDEPIEDTFGFEDGQLPEGFTAENYEMVDNIGSTATGASA